MSLTQDWRLGSARVVARNVDTGRVIADSVRIATGPVERAVGLLTRCSLEAGEALWIVPSRGVHTCGMRFAIDLIALDAAGFVVDVVADLKPWRVRLPRRGTAGVLELPAGSLNGSGTRLGHNVTFEVLLDGSHRHDTVGS